MFHKVTITATQTGYTVLITSGHDHREFYKEFPYGQMLSLEVNALFGQLVIFMHDIIKDETSTQIEEVNEVTFYLEGDIFK